jgi:hypothetical protein
LALLTFTACELSPAEMFEPELNIHCLLLAEQDSASALVNRTYAIDDPYVEDFRGASVLLWNEGDTWELAEQENGRYKETGFAPPVSHDTYGIQVTHPGFDTVLGSTVVPDTFSFLHPMPGDTVDQYDSLVWSRSRSCVGYYMSMEQVIDSDTFSCTIRTLPAGIPPVPRGRALHSAPVCAGPELLRLDVRRWPGLWRWVEHHECGHSRRCRRVRRCGAARSSGLLQTRHVKFYPEQEEIGSALCPHREPAHHETFARQAGAGRAAICQPQRNRSRLTQPGAGPPIGPQNRVPARAIARQQHIWMSHAANRRAADKHRPVLAGGDAPTPIRAVPRSVVAPCPEQLPLGGVLHRQDVER